VRLVAGNAARWDLDALVEVRAVDAATILIPLGGQVGGAGERRALERVAGEAGLDAVDATLLGDGATSGRAVEQLALRGATQRDAVVLALHRDVGLLLAVFIFIFDRAVGQAA